MFTRLRRFFILISLGSIGFVLAMSIAAINIYNFSRVNRDADSKLELAIREAEKGFYGFMDEGERPENGWPQEGEQPSNNGQPGDGTQRPNNGRPEDGTEPPEKPGDNDDIDSLRKENYFVFRYNSVGENVGSTRFANNGWITESLANSLAYEVLQDSKDSGIIDDLRYKKESRNGDTYVAFIDINKDLSSNKHFLSTSILSASISFAVLAVLNVLASFVIFKPSQLAYQKQKKFITNASHELKTPLTIINTDIEIIEMDNGVDEWSTSIKDQVNRLTVMTNQLVTLSKLDENNKANYPFRVFWFCENVHKSVDAFAPLYEKQGLSLTSNITDEILIKGNEPLIDQLIYILLDNANKYTKDKGQIAVSLTKTNKNQILLSVSNDIEEDSQIDVEQLFDRFYRAPTAKTSGSGIGLSIASEIVKLHKGPISAYIENNKIHFEVIFKLVTKF